ncbi:MAG: restriction endonuclease subunit S [Wenzhouxiangella sp.]
MTDSLVPPEWHRTRLSAIANWGSGGTPSRKNPEYYGGPVPWVKTGDLGPKVLSAASEYITELGVQKSSAKYFPKGSVAIAMYGATIGKTSILGFDATTNQACAVGQPVEGITDTTFLYYLLRNEKDAFIAKGKGGAQPNISQALIKEHAIALPPLAEQKVIADKLDTLLAQVDNTKARLERIPQILKRFRQSVLSAAVSGRLTQDWRDLNPNRTTEALLKEHEPLPKPARWKSRSDAFVQGNYATAVGRPSTSPVPHWKWISLVEVARMESGHTPSRNKPEYWDGDVCWIGIKDANKNHGKTIHDTEQKTNPLGLANSASRLLPTGTVCVSRTASVGYVVKMGKDMATSQDFVNWVPSPVIDPDWLKWLFVAERDSLLKFGKGSTHTTVYFPEWLSMHVLLPHIDEQREIVRRVDQLFAHADRIEQQVNNALARVNKLTQSILAKAFRGELTEQWRQDHPDLISGENSAEALLQRIKAERAAATPARRTRKAKRRG